MVSPLENATFDFKSSPMTSHLRGFDASPKLAKPLILESHARCQYLGLKAFESCDYDTQSSADIGLTLERNARLVAQTTAVLTMLDKTVANLGSMIVLTDETGTILRTHCQSTFIEKANRVALRPGVNWAESSKGTNAIGTALILESNVYVQGEEHYFESNHFLSCAASPILNHSGNVIGVLDASGDKRLFHPHTMGLVEMCARTIENNCFLDNFRQNIKLHFHPLAELIGTVEEGIIAFGVDGQILGANRAGRNILSISASTLRVRGVRTLFGFGFGELLEKLRHGLLTPLKLESMNGNEIYARVSGHESSLTWNSTSAPIMRGRPLIVTSGHSSSSSKTLQAVRKATYQLDELDAGDAQIRLITQKVRRVIDKDIPILIVGETGTGKELLARAIHQYSQRCNEPFIAINCASIPEQLIESELFGYEEGAFTGARRKGMVGKLLQSNGGTLFLDEIGDMPLPLQARLLRVLQERKVVPLGGHSSTDFDVNLICATHRNLRELMAQRTFRDDLYYRINGISVKLPPLRERTDLAALCQKILLELSPNRPLTLQTQLVETFLRYAWPGNLRQLSNILKTAAVLVENDCKITLAHLPDDFLEELAAAHRRTLPNGATDVMAPLATPGSEMSPVDSVIQKCVLPISTAVQADSTKHLERVEITAIMQVLNACSGNISLASKQLNISRNTIYRKIKKFI